eukprot:3705527-Prymnesium_polylepis.2
MCALSSSPPAQSSLVHKLNGDRGAVVLCVVVRCPEAPQAKDAGEQLDGRIVPEREPECACQQCDDQTQSVQLRRLLRAEGLALPVARRPLEQRTVVSSLHCRPPRL